MTFNVSLSTALVGNTEKARMRAYEPVRWLENHSKQLCGTYKVDRLFVQREDPTKDPRMIVTYYFTDERDAVRFKLTWG